MITPEGFIEVEYEVAKVISSTGGVIYSFGYSDVFSIRLLNESGEHRTAIYSHICEIDEYYGAEYLDIYSIDFVTEDDYKRYY